MAENKRRGRPPKQQNADMQQVAKAVVENKTGKLRYMQQFKEDLEKNPPSAPAPDVIERYIRNAGRPPKYKTPEEMQEIIVNYFRSNMAEVYDDSGEFRGYQWCNRISIGDLSIHLGMTIQRLWDYGERDAFAETVKSAKNIIENYYEKILQENRNPAGICFILKNGFGWRDVSEMKIEPVNPLGEARSVEAAQQYAKQLESGMPEDE